MSTCPICGGLGLVRVRSSAGLWVSRPCDCQELQREERRIAAARVPERYKDYDLDGFHVLHESDPSIKVVVSLVALGDAGGGNAALLALEFLAIAGTGSRKTGGGPDADQAEAAAVGQVLHSLFQRSAGRGCGRWWKSRQLFSRF